MRFLKFAIFSLVMTGAQAHAEKLARPSHLSTPAQREVARQWNRSFRQPLEGKAWPVARPFREAEVSGYVAIAGDSNYELPALREAIAKNLPANATMVIYIAAAGAAADLKAQYGKYLGDRLKFLVVPEDSGADPIWARDSLPFPVYLNSQEGKTSAGLVDSIYPQNFEPDGAFAKALELPMVATNQYYRGGNLQIDSQSNCIAENASEVADLKDPQTFFKQYFGCASVNLLKQEGGIGDIDERLKFLDGMMALTDNANYAAQLTQLGYTVVRIPSIDAEYETYMNTLLVNGTVFVPQMGLDSDKDALQAYEALGLKAVGVKTKALADEGLGNIHCVTMNYPPGVFTASVRGADFLEFRH